MLYSGTDPESYITECTLVYEDNALSRQETGDRPEGPGRRHQLVLWPLLVILLLYYSQA